MNFDDIWYLCLLIASVAIGSLYRNLNSFGLGRFKKEFGTLIGILTVYAVSGYHIAHPIAATCITILILKICPEKICHFVSFVCLFAYLLFFRLCYKVGIPSAPNHTNAIQMILTLKLIGVCYEVHDTWKKKGQLKKMEDGEQKKSLELEVKYESVEVSSVDIFHYAFCYVGILVGPYFKFRVYQDMISSSSEGKLNANCFNAMISRIKVIPIYVVLFLISDHYFPLKFAESDRIFEKYSILYRLWYMTPIFFTFRMRIYAGFVFGECVCIAAGLGAYPTLSKPRPGKGPTDLKALDDSYKSDDEIVFDFETVHNIDEYGSDFSPTVRSGMRCWNMTVQYWLANFVYKRVTLAKPLKEALTVLTSAYWHGIHSGYYLAFLTVPFILAVEDYYERILRRKLGTTGQKVYDWVSWFIKMQNFAYMGMAFLLLRIDSTFNYWRSVGFLYHGGIFFAHAIAGFCNLIIEKTNKKINKIHRSARTGDSLMTVIRKEPPTETVEVNKNT